MIGALAVSLNANCDKCKGESCKDCHKKKKVSRAYTLIAIVLIVFAVYTAVKCNPSNPWGYGILALLFPEPYLIIHYGGQALGYNKCETLADASQAPTGGMF